MRTFPNMGLWDGELARVVRGSRGKSQLRPRAFPPLCSTLSDLSEDLFVNLYP